VGHPAEWVEDSARRQCLPSPGTSMAGGVEFFLPLLRLLLRLPGLLILLPQVFLVGLEGLGRVGRGRARPGRCRVCQGWNGQGEGERRKQEEPDCGFGRHLGQGNPP